MKRSGFKPRSKPLDRSGSLGKAQGHSDQPKKPRKALPAQNRARRAKLFARCFHSKEFVAFTKGRECVCRGKGRQWGCNGRAAHTSHDPSRGAGGTWKDTHPASEACHQRIGEGAESFWIAIGRTREDANREHHFAWLEFNADDTRSPR